MMAISKFRTDTTLIKSLWPQGPNPCNILGGPPRIVPVHMPRARVDLTQPAPAAGSRLKRRLIRVDGAKEPRLNVLERRRPHAALETVVLVGGVAEWLVLRQPAAAERGVRSLWHEENQ